MMLREHPRVEQVDLSSAATVRLTDPDQLYLRTTAKLAKRMQETYKNSGCWVSLGSGGRLKPNHERCGTAAMRAMRTLLTAVMMSVHQIWVAWQTPEHMLPGLPNSPNHHEY
jgi:hypothetical protein